MGLKSLLQKYTRQDRRIIVYRYPSGGYKAGVYSTSVATKIEVWASVQPVNTDYTQEIVSVPGNSVRYTSTVKVFTEMEILMDNQAKSQRADRVMIDGVMYEARSGGKFGYPGSTHYETICVRVADK